MNSAERIIKKRLPNTFRYMAENGWVVDGRTRKDHFWLLHVETGRRAVAPSTPGSYTSDRNTIRDMKRVQREALS